MTNYASPYVVLLDIQSMAGRALRLLLKPPTIHVFATSRSSYIPKYT